MRATHDPDEIARRLAALRERIAAAAARVGRDGAEVSIVAVTKGHPVEAVRGALRAGCADLGENYVQEMLAKMEAVGDGPRWHLIGPLQRNKARAVVGRVALLHTVDSVPLVAELEKRAAARGVHVDVLCQVNVSGEAQKSGCAPTELPHLLEAIAGCRHLVPRGLMTMPPLYDDPEATRPHFRALRALRDEVAPRFPEMHLSDLSMGMSGDFEVAVEEGATIVRIGTALFGERPPKEQAR